MSGADESENERNSPLTWPKRVVSPTKAHNNTGRPNSALNFKWHNFCVTAHEEQERGGSTPHDTDTTGTSKTCQTCHMVTFHCENNVFVCVCVCLCVSDTLLLTKPSQATVLRADIKFLIKETRENLVVQRVQCGKVSLKFGLMTKAILQVIPERTMCATKRCMSSGCMGLVTRSLFHMALDMLCQELHDLVVGDAT